MLRANHLDFSWLFKIIRHRVISTISTGTSTLSSITPLPLPSPPIVAYRHIILRIGEPKQFSRSLIFYLFGPRIVPYGVVLFFALPEASSIFRWSRILSKRKQYVLTPNKSFFLTFFSLQSLYFSPCDDDNTLPCSGVYNNPWSLNTRAPVVQSPTFVLISSDFG